MVANSIPLRIADGDRNPLCALHARDPAKNLRITQSHIHLRDGRLIRRFPGKRDRQRGADRIDHSRKGIGNIMYAVQRPGQRHTRWRFRDDNDSAPHL